MTAKNTLNVTVDLGARSYDILIGRGVLGDLANHLEPVLKSPRVVTLTDDNVAPLYLEAVTTQLQAADIAVQSVVLPAGEATKSFDHLIPLVEDLLASRIERSTTLIALGKSVV